MPITAPPVHGQTTRNVRDDGQEQVRAGDRLAEAAVRGDHEAIQQFWEANRRWVAAVILSYKPSFEDLEDLLQEVAVTFVSKATTIREGRNLRAWLRTVAMNASRAAGRRSKNRARPECPEALDALPGSRAAGSASEILGRDEETQTMLRRVDRLPESYREPLMLRTVHGLKSKQVGELLGIPPQTVDTRVARARRMLREAGRDERPTGGTEETGGVE